MEQILFFLNEFAKEIQTECVIDMIIIHRFSHPDDNCKM